jgi:serine/threonine protein kinase
MSEPPRQIAPTVYSEPFGRFVLQKLLGKGGMGEVWLALDTRDGGTVALKRIHPDLSEDGRRRLRLEVEALTRLRHPRICTVLEWGNEGGRQWFTMEALSGRPLSTILGERGPRPIPLPEVRAIALGVVDALAAAHAARVVHRDLKPENIFVCDDGQPKLLDFGIAKVRDEESGASLFGTAPGIGRYTPQYMAPEQATRKDPIGPATDLYALGVVLFELLAGRLPFHSDTQMGYVAQHLGEEPPPLSRLRPGTPGSLDRLLARLLAKRAADRFPSADALREPLRAALAELEASDEEMRRRAEGALEATPVPVAPPRPRPVVSTAEAKLELASDDSPRHPWEASSARKEEYAQAALALGNEIAELRKLAETHRDLERAVDLEDASPFAFARCSGLPAALLERIAGRGLGDAIVDLALSDAEIAALLELGRALAAPHMHEATRRSGKIFFALASAREVLQRGAPRDPAKVRALRELFAGVRDKGYVVERYRKLIERAASKLAGAVREGA